MAHVQYQTSVPWDSTLADLGYTSDGYVESAVKTTTGAPTATAGKFIPAAQILNKVSGITYTNTGSTASPTWTALGGGGGGIAIGDTVTDADAASILYVDGSGNLTQDAGFTRDVAGGNTTILNTTDFGGGEVLDGGVITTGGITTIQQVYSNASVPTYGASILIDGTEIKLKLISANIITGKQNGLEIANGFITIGDIAGGNNTKITIDDVNQLITVSNVPTYADDAAAGVGGLTSGMLYKTTTTGVTALNIVP